MIVALDQLLWRPVVVWAQKFRVEEGGDADAMMSSWFLDWLRRSRSIVTARAARLIDRERIQEQHLAARSRSSASRASFDPASPSHKTVAGYRLPCCTILPGMPLAYGAWQLLFLLLPSSRLLPGVDRCSAGIR